MKLICLSSASGICAIVHKWRYLHFEIIETLFPSPIVTI